MHCARRFCTPKAQEAHEAAFASAATMFANALSPSLQEIWMLKYVAYVGPFWAVFALARVDEGAGSHVRVERQDDRPYLNRA